MGLRPLTEKDTPGLSLGSFTLDSNSGTITVSINDRSYVYKPIETVDVYDLYRSITGMAKYSTGRALAYLKTKAVGIRSESLWSKIQRVVVLDSQDSYLNISDYTEFLSAVGDKYKSAPVIKDDRTGIELYVDPQSSQLVAAWSATNSQGRVLEAAFGDTDDIDNLEDWMSKVKDPDDTEVDKVGDVSLMTARDKSGKILGTFVTGDEKSGRGQVTT